MEQENGTWQNDRPGQTIIIRQEIRKSNGMGTAGFVLALISLFCSWLPVVNWVVWFLGLLLSFIGMFKRPRGLAVAGFIISLFDFILIVILLGIFAAIVAY